MNISILLQAGGANAFASFIPMILIVFVMYFFMIRPQMKKAKDHKKYIEELGVNDRVITNAGIHGRIVEVSDTSFVIDVGGGVKIRFEKNAIALDASKALNAK